MITRGISWGKDNRCLGLTNLPLSCREMLEASKFRKLILRVSKVVVWDTKYKKSVKTKILYFTADSVEVFL
jgi:hypothetical protein